MWNWIKLPKGAALLAFVLPWMTVSCQGQPLAKATGFGLAFGQVETMGRAAGNSAGANLLLQIAIGVIVLGLGISFARGRKAAIASLATSAAALVLILAGTMRYTRRTILAAADAKGASGSDPGEKLGRAMLEMIQVNWHFGYYCALIALGMAALMALLVLSEQNSSG